MNCSENFEPFKLAIQVRDTSQPLPGNQPNRFEATGDRPSKLAIRCHADRCPQLGQLTAIAARLRATSAAFMAIGTGFTAIVFAILLNRRGQIHFAQARATVTFMDRAGHNKLLIHSGISFNSPPTNNQDFRCHCHDHRNLARLNALLGEHYLTG
jgi:hypothetical protein